MKKIIIYYNFIIVTLLVIIGFLQATTLAQIVTAILFFPLTMYFGYFILPQNKRAIHIEKPTLPAVIKKGKNKALQRDERKETITEGTVLEKNPFDIDRRMFLKLIGSAGITVFFFSLFTKRAEATFFGSAPAIGTISVKDSTGTVIDPAIKSPTDGYKITEIDDAGANTYVGFLDKSGAWYIQKDDGSSYRYIKGASSFSTNWTGRASLTYGYFDAIF